jgi:hypothetical protein
MPKEQKECCRGLKGCKDQLLISKAILQECKSKKKYVCTAWIDYQKAFDSMPHSWTIKSLELTGIYRKTISLTKKTTSYWKKSMFLYTEQKLIETEDIHIQCGIFQRRLITTTTISWGGKGGQCVRLTTLPSSRANYLKIWETQPPRILRACQGLLQRLLYLCLLIPITE